VAGVKNVAHGAFVRNAGSEEDRNKHAEGGEDAPLHRFVVLCCTVEGSSESGNREEEGRRSKFATWVFILAQRCERSWRV
jgi:hypothetical protein